MTTLVNLDFFKNTDILNYHQPLNDMALDFVKNNFGTENIDILNCLAQVKASPDDEIKNCFYPYMTSINVCSLTVDEIHPIQKYCIKGPSGLRNIINDGLNQTLLNEHLNTMSDYIFNNDVKKQSFQPKITLFRKFVATILDENNDFVSFDAVEYFPADTNLIDLPDDLQIEIINRTDDTKVICNKTNFSETVNLTITNAKNNLKSFLHTYQQYTDLQNVFEIWSLTDKHTLVSNAVDLSFHFSLLLNQNKINFNNVKFV